MSAISFRVPDLGRLRRPRALGTRADTRGVVIDAALFVFCATMLWLMTVYDGNETIPYHFLFLALTIVYGFRVWALGPTFIVISAVTVSTGWIMTQHVLDGSIDQWSELAEIPLMPALVVAMVWHARRREEAQARERKMAEERAASLEREREFFRDTSHAIRTPVTIARGHLELLEPTLVDEVAREDVGVVLRQLDRMSALSNRLLALAQLDAGLALRLVPTTLHDIVDEIGRDWSSSADRDWKVDAAPPDVTVGLDHEWFALAVDAVVENAVHFTSTGDQIEITSGVNGGWCTIKVADHGPGIDQADLPFIFERFWHRRPAGGEMGSGLGLPMALAIVRAHSGRLAASNREGGGAVFEVALPTQAAV
jgi:signal transduction histidine kinase